MAACIPAGFRGSSSGMLCTTCQTVQCSAVQCSAVQCNRDILERIRKVLVRYQRNIGTYESWDTQTHGCSISCVYAHSRRACSPCPRDLRPRLPLSCRCLRQCAQSPYACACAVVAAQTRCVRACALVAVMWRVRVTVEPTSKVSQSASH